jgi:hypothetical protein
MKYSILTVLLFTLFACGGEASPYSPAEIASQSTAYDEMMDIHNRVMPRMGEIAQAQKGMMNAMDSTGIAEDRQLMYNQVNEQLEMAHDGMMEWMQQVKSLDELRKETSHADILTYIERENVKMLEIEGDLNQWVSKAKELLAE